MSAAPAIRERSTALAHTTPAWRPWLDRLDLALAEDATGHFDSLRSPLSTHSRAPALEGAELRLPSRPTLRWAKTLFGRRITREHVPTFLHAALTGNRAAIEALAVVADVEGDALAADAQVAVIPILFALRRKLGDSLPAAAASGSCPVCGSWPALAESRGLERLRRLRCGSCGSDWSSTWLHCIHCGESDHRRLGSLVPDSGGDSRRVDTCETCHGYVKTIATLTALDPAVVPYEDLATVDLDVAAIEHGFSVPARAPLDCRLVLES
jgi:FdhE protein